MEILGEPRQGGLERGAREQDRGQLGQGTSRLLWTRHLGAIHGEGSQRQGLGAKWAGLEGQWGVSPP